MGDDRRAEPAVGAPSPSTGRPNQPTPPIKSALKPIVRRPTLASMVASGNFIDNKRQVDSADTNQAGARRKSVRWQDVQEEATVPSNLTEGTKDMMRRLAPLRAGTRDSTSTPRTYSNPAPSGLSPTARPFRPRGPRAPIPRTFGDKKRISKEEPTNKEE